MPEKNVKLKLCADELTVLKDVHLYYITLLQGGPSGRGSHVVDTKLHVMSYSCMESEGDFSTEEKLGVVLLFVKEIITSL